MARKSNQEQESLQLREGMSLEVLTKDNQVIFVARAEEVSRKSVKLVSATGEALPQVFYNTEVQLRGFLSDATTVMFRGVVRGNSPRFWLIEELAGEVRQGRSFFRQSVSVKARVSCANGIFAPDQKRTRRGQIVDCEILDISGGGIQISTTEEYHVGDWLTIMEVNFTPVKEMFSFTCQVLRAEYKRNKYLYGCQFEGLTQKEQDRLVETVFLLQREEAQHKQRRSSR